MILDKALLVKGAAGVAAVGGIATTGGIVFKDQIRGAFSSSPKANASSDATEGKEKPGQNQGDSVQSDSVAQGQQATDNSLAGGGSQNVQSTPINQPADGAAATGSQVPGGAAPGGVGASSPSEPRETEEERKEKKKNEVNKKLTDLGLGNCHFTEGEITNVDTFSKECVLDETKFKAINFSNKGSGSITLGGWVNDITLKIENKEQNKIKYTFKDVTSKLTIVGASGNGVITLPKSEEREFEEKSGKLSKISKNNTQEESKLKALNQKLKGIKIPERCWFDESEKDESIECDLSNKTDELKKIEFSNKEWGKDSKIDGSTSGLKLTINRLSTEEAKLKHDYPTTDLEFIFGNLTSEIKIQDSRTSNNFADIVLKPNTNPILTISQNTSTNNNTLSKAFIINNLSLKMGLSCTSTLVPCTPSGSDTKIRIFTEEENLEEIDVQKSQENDQIICVTENVANYEQGIKFTVTQAFPSSETSSLGLEKGDYQAKYITGKGWGLVKKTN